MTTARMCFNDPDCVTCDYSETVSDGDGWRCVCCGAHWDYEANEQTDGYLGDGPRPECPHFPESRTLLAGLIA